MEAQQIVDVFRDVAAAVREQIGGVEDWGPSGNRPDQYKVDVVADEVALSMLGDAGFSILSEESGITARDNASSGVGHRLVCIVDPIDGSTNAHAGLPWFATSLCAVDDAGPLAAVVVNQASGTTWHATRGGGAFRDDRAIGPSGTARLSDALVAISGAPAHPIGWKQFRCYGAAALDICSVADGTFDAFADLSVDAHGVWDYAGAMLVLEEAGGTITDRHGRDLVTQNHTDRRTPIAAATAGLLSELVQAL